MSVIGEVKIANATFKAVVATVAAVVAIVERFKDVIHEIKLVIALFIFPTTPKREVFKLVKAATILLLITADTVATVN